MNKHSTHEYIQSILCNRYIEDEWNVEIMKAPFDIYIDKDQTIMDFMTI